MLVKSCTLWVSPSKKARTEISITFDDSDLEGVKFLHDDPLVIMPTIGNNVVKRVLVDNGASMISYFMMLYLRWVTTIHI